MEIIIKMNGRLLFLFLFFFVSLPTASYMSVGEAALAYLGHEIGKKLWLASGRLPACISLYLDVQS